MRIGGVREAAAIAPLAVQVEPPSTFFSMPSGAPWPEKRVVGAGTEQTRDGAVGQEGGRHGADAAMHHRHPVPAEPECQVRASSSSSTCVGGNCAPPSASVASTRDRRATASAPAAFGRQLAALLVGRGVLLEQRPDLLDLLQEIAVVDESSPIIRA